MELPDLDGSGPFNCDARQVSIRFAWFRVFEICVLKFGSVFGNWNLEF